MTESNQRKNGAFLSYVSIIITTIVQLLYTPLLIRMMGQSEYGLYSLVSSIIGYLTVLDLGFGNAIVVYTAKYRAQKKYEEEKKLHGMFRIIFTILAIVVALLGILLYILVPTLFSSTMSNIELQKAKTMMLILSLNLFVTFIFTIYSSIITSYERFVFQKILSILNTIVKPMLMIPLLFMGYKSIAMALVITAINVAICISNYIYCRRKLNIKIKYYGFDKKLFKMIFGYSFFIFLGVVVDKINWSLDQFILGVVSGTTAISLYSVASSINALFINLSTGISSVMLPKVSKMVAMKASNEELTDEFIKIGRLQYFLIFLLASGIVLFGKNFIIAWAGKNYEQSYYITIALILPICIPLIQNLGISIMQAKNMHKFRSILLIMIAIMNIFISIPLAKLYGGLGCAIGTGLSLLIGNGLIINLYYYYKVGINIVAFWKNITKMSIYFLIPIALISIMMKFIKISGITNVVIFGGIYTIIYVFVCFTLVMNSYEKNMVQSLVKKIIKH